MKREVRLWMIALAAACALAACGDDDDDDDDGVDAGMIDAAPEGPDAAPEADGAPGDAGPADDAAPGLDGAAAAVVEVDCEDVTVDTEVSMEGIEFIESAETVQQGGVVRWTNDENPGTGPSHTVTSGDPELPEDEQGAVFDSGLIAPGESFCLRFDVAETFEYFCRTHPEDMRDATSMVEDP